MLEALAALVKFCLYAGALAGAGTAFASASLGRQLGEGSQRAPAIMLAASAVTLIAAGGNVLVLLMRLGGDFGGPALEAVFGGPPGLAAGLQAAGAFLLALFSRVIGRLSAGRLVAGMLLMSSFAVSGHAASRDAVPSLVAFLHVSAAGWWLGALLLLAPACQSLAIPDLLLLVRKFSAMAMAIVAGLALAGTFLVTVLVNFDRAPWQSAYVQTLATKIGLAVCVLGLAAFNKFSLTPRLQDGAPGAIRALQASIGLEVILISTVLAATAILTTYTSPHA